MHNAHQFKHGKKEEKQTPMLSGNESRQPLNPAAKPKEQGNSLAQLENRKQRAKSAPLPILHPRANAHSSFPEKTGRKSGKLI